MNSRSDQLPRHRRYTARHQARLDEEAYAKLEELAAAFHRKRAAILRYVMQWGLSHGKDRTIDQSIPASVQLVPVLLEPELLQQVQDAADIHGASVAAWVRHAMRQVTIEDLPASWRAGETTGRSHELGYYGRKFGLRLDEETSQKLDTLSPIFHRSAAEVIRQLIDRAQPEDFPQRWHFAVEERQQWEAHPAGGHR
jgi:predicted transcriptional regulator